MNNDSPRTLKLGEEFDEAARQALHQVLLDLNASMVDEKWGIGGSQEIETVTVRIEERELLVEAETYIGLTITGDDDLVTVVANLVSEKLLRDKSK